MKVIIYNLLLFLALCFASCQNSDYDYDNLFPDEYNTIFGIKNNDSGTAKNLGKVSRTGETSQSTIVILKGGAQPSTVATVKIEKWSDDKISEYETLMGEKYKLLPANAYSLNSDEFEFGADDRAKDLVITFYNNKVVECINANGEYTYLLPLRLVSDKTVNERQAEIVIPISLVD